MGRFPLAIRLPDQLKARHGDIAMPILSQSTATARKRFYCNAQ
jgi:hypothetical protein